MEIIHGKDEFSKIKGSIAIIPVEAANIYHFLPRPAVSNRLIVIKVERDLKYKGHAYFEGETERITEKNIYDGKKISENLNGNRSETEFTLVEDPLNRHRTT